MYVCLYAYLLLHWVSRQHLTSATAKTNAQAIFLAVPTNDDLIVVLQEFSCLAALKLHVLGATPAQLQQRAVRVGCFAAYRARCH